tara:strand:- start:1483 stop:2265 length:783 start_codon:yes stop_codon:yes gene_type:complete
MKASNIFQNKGVKSEGGKGPEIKNIGSPFKKRKGCGPQRLGSPIKMGMKHSSPMQFNAGLKKAAAEGKLDKNPKFKAAVESSPAKKNKLKNFAKKATDAAVDMAVGLGGRLPGVKDKVQSFKNKKNRALGLGVTYDEAYADADKKKYPSKESFKKAAKEYNKKKSPVKKKGTKAGAAKRKAIIAKVRKEGEAKVSASAKKSPAKKYKSDAQRKAVHASKADGGKGAPAKMYKKSPAKKYKKSPAKKYKKASPAKAHCNKK